MQYILFQTVLSPIIACPKSCLSAGKLVLLLSEGGREVTYMKGFRKEFFELRILKKSHVKITVWL